MSDPIDQVLDGIDPTAPVVEPTTPDTQTNTATIDKAELERLQAIAEQFNQVAPTIQMLQQNPNLIHDLRARIVDQAAPAPAADPNAEFWTDPAQQTQKIAQQVAAQQTQRTNQQLGQMIVNNYLLSKQSSEFYHVATPIFNDLTKNLDRAALAQQDPNQVQFILNAAWDSAVGQWTQRRKAEMKKNPPTNLGGGSGAGGAGGPKVKKTLAEVNPAAYAMAVNAGLTAEEMQEIADQEQGDE